MLQIFPPPDWCLVSGALVLQFGASPLWCINPFVKMYQVSKQISFCYGHRLLKHPGKCARLHGHNAVAEIVCASRALNSSQMVVDFEAITGALRSWIDSELDHRMILNRQDPLVPVLKKWHEPCFLTTGNPTAEAIAKLVFDRAKQAKLPVQKVVLWETPTSSASYCG